MNFIPAFKNTRLFITTCVLAAMIFGTIITAVIPASSVWAADCSTAGGNQVQCEACQGGGGNWTGSVCEQTSGSSIFGQDSIFQSIANILTFIVGAASVVMLIVGGVKYVLSQGNQEQIQSAKNTIMYAFIGIVVAFLAFAAVNWLTGVLIKPASQTNQSTTP